MMPTLVAVMKAPNFRKLFAVTMAVLWSAVVVPAEEPLVTDRPDFTESSSTVGRGVIQFEGGVTGSRLSGGGDVTTVGEVLARWGVSQRLELRFVLPTYSRVSDAGNDDSGFLSTAVGFKYGLARGGGSGFIGGMKAALIASTTVPTGTADFSSSRWQPSAVLAASWSLGSNVGVGSNLGVSRPAGADQRFTTLWASVSMGVGLTDSTAVFVELYGFNREEERGPSIASFQTGFVHLVNPDFQLDVRAARRLTDRGVDFLLGAGLSYRLGG